MKTKFPEGSNFEKTIFFSKNVLFWLFEPEKLQYIKSRSTKIVRNMKTHFLRSKLQEKIIDFFLFTGATDTANSNQILSQHLDDIVFYNLLFLVRI
jgi:hypothetical protein